MSDPRPARPGSSRDRVAAAVRAAGADAGTLWRCTPNGTLEVDAAVGYPPGLVEASAPLPLSGPLPPAVAARDDHAVTVSSTTELELSFPALSGGPHPGAAALACLPVRAGGGGAVSGVLGLSFSTPRTFDEETVDELTHLAQELGELLANGAGRGPGPHHSGGVTGHLLRRSEARYRSLVDASGEAVWVTDAEGAPVEGAALEEAATASPAMPFSGTGWLDSVHPADQDETARAWREAVRTKRPFEHEFRVGGRHQWRSTLGRAVPVVEDGRVVEWVGTSTDITEVRAAQQDREQFATLVDATDDVTALLSVDGRVSYLNHAGRAALGLPEAGDVTRTLADLLGGNSALTLLEKGLPAASESGSWRGEVDLGQAPDGSPRRHDLTLFRVPGAGPPRFAAVARDITGRLRDEAAREGLLRLTTALSPALSRRAVAAAVITEMPPFIGAYSANLALFDDDGVTLHFIDIDKGFPDEAVRDWRVFDVQADAPIAEAARTGRPLFHRTRAEFVAGRPHLEGPAEASGVHAWASLPLAAGGRILGVLGLTWVPEQPFDAAQRTYLLTVADACAQALERARLHELDHDIAVALQKALLPQQLPEVPGVGLAARYLAGAEGVDVGGDWYDVLHAPGGALVVTLGDVMGRGATAAALMGQVRAATRAYAALSSAPSHVAASLDRMFAEFQVDDALVTLVYAVVDPVSHTLELVNLGHLPPLLVHDGRASQIVSEQGLPLGVLDAPERRSTTVTLPRHATVLLYTDGLVEHRGRPLDDGFAQLDRVAVEAARRHPEDLPRLCDDVIREMLRGVQQDDDVALLALRLDVGR